MQRRVQVGHGSSTLRALPQQRPAAVPAAPGRGGPHPMLYEVASIAHSPTHVVAVASFLNLKKVEGSSGPQFLKF